MLPTLVFFPGSVLAGRYEVVRLLGVGGMGAVYQVKDAEMDNDLKALKAMLPKLVSSQTAQERFRREVKVLQKLSHPNILRVHELGKHDSLMFFTMEYVDGLNVREWLELKKQQQRAIPVQEVIALGFQILQGLEEAHKQTVHRDMKPENLLLTKDGTVKIGDFGLAQMLEGKARLSMNHGLGTFSYAAPEQLHTPDQVDQRADIYSVGVVLYELLTGSVPQGAFAAPGEENPQVPAWFGDIVMKALRPKPDKRFQTAGQMREALANNGQPTGAVQPPAGSGRFVAMIGFVLLTMAGLLVLYIQTPNGYGWWTDLWRDPAPKPTIVTVPPTTGISEQETERKPNRSVPAHSPLYLTTGISEQEAERKRQEEQARQMPIDPSVWQACWNGSYFDFTQDAWTGLAHGQQGDYAAKYQAWYAQQKGLSVSKTFTAGGTSFEMMLIPPGRFWMGSPDSELDRDSDEKRHRVTITKAYWLQKTEITQRQWRTVTGSSPWSGKEYMENNDNWAAACISWKDIQDEFLPKLGGKYRLPTEAQWEYACRAGTLGRFYWGDSVADMGQYANVADKTAKRKHSDWTDIDTDDGYAQIAPVGQLKPNGFGLHDMIGNVHEWCGDWHDEDSGDISDPTVTPNGSIRVIRGGSWGGLRLMWLRSADRSWVGPSLRAESIGARLVFEAD